MSRDTLRLVLLVSCAHAMVHIYELSLPSFELLIGREYRVGTDVTGLLANCWRFPFGAGAILAGWLVDRFGSKPLLIVYLAGCVVTAAAAAVARDLSVLFIAMFAMGAFASIYHPAGLACISRAATPENRPQALGIHGIVGSVGIAAAPLMAAVALARGMEWRHYYLLLTLPGTVLAGLVIWRLAERHPSSPADGSQSQDSDEEAQWGSFAMLIAAGILGGFIYAALMSFLPRYLAGARIWTETLSPASLGNFGAAGVLLVGCIGQYVAGRTARAASLEAYLAWTMAATVPFLAWMAVAAGSHRLWAAAGFSLFFFMQQPLYNSLVAKYVPRRRSSLGFGISNMLCFGLGSAGATFAGYMPTELANYGSLAGMGLLAGTVAAGLWAWNRRKVLAATALAAVT
jgi:FSR family fosmidomycin resistance protein-like MFS transporter